jgi:hypothetical protein
MSPLLQESIKTLQVDVEGMRGTLASVDSQLPIIIKRLDRADMERLELRRGNQRLELLNAFEHHPLERALISKLYDAYKAQGGNSYIDKMYDIWASPNEEVPPTVKPRRGKNKD